MADSVPPLVVDFDVATDPRTAFETWVGRTALWWPRGHTISQAPDAVVFEPRVGGRIFERGPDGAEHDWGEVVRWEPPHRLDYRWHLFFARSEATPVSVTFTPVPGGTRVRLEQTGWDALGDQGPVRRQRTIAGWGAVTADYRRHIAETTN